MTIKVDPGLVSPRRRVIRAINSLVITALLAGLALWLVPGEAYLWIKALHIIAVISWMAGLLYLPRLFVYHCQCGVGTESSERFKVMERKLLEYIINPAMVAAWVLGLWMAWEIYGFQGGWLHVKLAMVVALSAVHGVFAGAVRRFAADQNTKSETYWRAMNEAPTILMIVIVILVVVKPF